MATLLLIIIYIAFIGLGIPDSLLGAAWPAIFRELALPISAQSVVTTFCCIITAAASVVSARVIERFGTPRVTAFSTLLTAVGLLGTAFSGSLWWFCLCAIPLGFGGGCVDAALNNYIALHYRAAHMNFLHCFYGVGVSLSPFLMSLALERLGSWRSGYLAAFAVQIAITAVTFIGLPVWSRVSHASEQSDEVQTRALSAREIFRTPGFFTICGIFVGSCAVECVCGHWGATFLVEARGLTVDDGAAVITFYYMGIAAGRFVSGLLAGKLGSWRLITIGACIVGAALVGLALPLPPAAAAVSLFLVGFGNGPVYPNMMHLTPKNFGREASQSMIGAETAAAYVGIVLFPPLFGVFAELVGAWTFPPFLMVMFAVFALSLVLSMRKFR